MIACRADVHEFEAHTCDDPLACALDRLAHGEDPAQVELGRLHDLLDRIEKACENSKDRVADLVLAAIHEERGGPR